MRIFSSDEGFFQTDLRLSGHIEFVQCFGANFNYLHSTLGAMYKIIGKIIYDRLGWYVLSSCRGALPSVK